MAKKGAYFNLDEDIHKQLKAFAMLNDVTMTEVVENLIESYCVLETKESNSINDTESKMLDNKE